MGTTRTGGAGTLAPEGSDGYGPPAPRRRPADPDVLGARVRHVLVDGAVLALLLAVPVTATLVATALSPSGLPVPLVPVAAVGLAGCAVLVGFGVLWPHHDGGRTAGMRRTGLRVVDRGGRAPSVAQLAVRGVALPVDLVVGPLLVLTRPDRRRLGDLLAGTQVVRDLSAGAAPAGRPGTARCPRARSRTAAPRPAR